MINTVLFDMDGLLLDTEPLWGESMLRIAGKHQIPITADRFKETTGLRINEVIDYWAIKYPWQGSTPQKVTEDVIDDIIELSRQRATVLKGVKETLELLIASNFKVGLASSSPYRMIEILVDHFGIREYFRELTSADAVGLGKPHPGVFLHCAQLLGADPLECVVLEDSVNGMIAGKAARMKVIVVPDEHHYNDPRFALADAKLRSLENFDLGLLQRL